MRKPEGGRRPTNRRPDKTATRSPERLAAPGKPGAYSQRLIRTSMKAARAGVPVSRVSADEDREARRGDAPRGKRAASRTGGAGDKRGGEDLRPVRRTRVPRPEGPKPPASALRAGPQDARGPCEPMRIAKAMARAGLCSRRDGERWIADGRVSVNGRILTTPAVEVGPDDRVLVDGAALPSAAPAQIWRYHKPRGLVTTHADPEGRPTVFDALPVEMPRVVSIGRLDFNTEGLLLLTNDGALARHLELPATGWLRRYRVRAFGRVSQADLDTLKEGVTIDGVRYGGIDAAIDSVQAGNMWLTIGLREGKNREVRRILGSLSLEVNRLIRVSYGPFQLMDLATGEVEAVKRRVLADQLGPEAARFGLTGAIDGYKARQSQDRPARPKNGGGES
jgi:23S rRNA pseudouridine2605 synthase